MLSPAPCSTVSVVFVRLLGGDPFVALSLMLSLLCWEEVLISSKLARVF